MWRQNIARLVYVGSLHDAGDAVQTYDDSEQSTAAAAAAADVQRQSARTEERLLRHLLSGEFDVDARGVDHINTTVTVRIQFLLLRIQGLVGRSCSCDYCLHSGDSVSRVRSDLKFAINISRPHCREFSSHRSDEWWMICHRSNRHRCWVQLYQVSRFPGVSINSTGTQWFWRGYSSAFISSRRYPRQWDVFRSVQ